MTKLIIDNADRLLKINATGVFLFELFFATGQKVKSSSEAVINSSNLPTGMYVGKLKSGYHVSSQKLVVE
ncbi:MAG: T9SS type A sorting domain-containing protein [Salinivirgaceae bacterium]|nr:T9SS type A sorting domain-containing protein [Salinivirgaceae bacterium]